MAQQIINIGAIPGDKTGDTLRTGGQKINANFAELYTKVANTFIPAQTGNSGRALYTDGATITWRDVKSLTNQNFVLTLDDYGSLVVPTQSQYLKGYITSVSPIIDLVSTQVSGGAGVNWFIPAGTTAIASPNDAISSKVYVNSSGAWLKATTATNTYRINLNTSGQLSLPSYILPNAVGTTGQVLSWPGSGTTLSWTTPTVYTDTLARAAISVSGSLSYNSTSGVISYTTPTYTVSTATATGGGALSLSGTTFTFTPASIPTTVTINGTSVTLGSSGTVTAAAGTLTGIALNSTIVTSSLTSVGTLGSLTVSGTSNLGTVATTGLTLRAINFIPVGSTATYALSTTVSYNVLVVSTTALTATITLPPSPVDQQLVSFTVASNTVTLAMTAGPTVVPAFAGAGIVSGTVFQYVYRASNSTWYRN